MSFAEHAIAQVLREVADDIFRQWDSLTRPVTVEDLIDVLEDIADKLSPKPPGEK